MEKTMDIFQKRKITYTLVFLSLILIFCGASLVTQFHLAEGIQSFPAALHWIFSNLIPDETAMERLPKILDKLVETALLSVAVTVLAGIFLQSARLGYHKNPLEHQSSGAYRSGIFPKCTRCCMGDAADVLLWAEHPDRIFRIILYYIRPVDPCVYRNH